MWKVAPMGPIICTGSNIEKSSKLKCNKILWIKIRKKRPCDLELLLWTSTKDQMKRVGKLIGASVTRAYKNAHLLIGMVCKWEIDQIEWQEIRKNKSLSSVSSWELTRGSVPHCDVRHNVIKRRGLSVWVHGLLYQRYTKSSGHYRRCNDILFTPYPTHHILDVGIIELDKEVRIELSNQGS